MTAPIAAIFDMDDTLLRGSSGRMLFEYLRQTGRLYDYFRRRDIPAFIVAALLYRLHLLDPTGMILRMGRAAAGAEASTLWDISRRWFADMLVHMISRTGVERLAWHKEQGHIPVICSGSSQFPVQLLAEHLGIQETICSEWLIEDGKLTGELRQPLVYGPGKVYWIERWAKKLGVDLANSFFYTDHISDRPLLERVAHPVAVNPDRKLARLARKRRWTIETWE
ncbi:MAG: HAD family hydrolase [Caldilineae bacterium]|nr:MAG: HAD family hydrolase [Caldilineae bacterium]